MEISDFQILLTKIEIIKLLRELSFTVSEGSTVFEKLKSYKGIEKLTIEKKLDIDILEYLKAKKGVDFKSSEQVEKINYENTLTLKRREAEEWFENLSSKEKDMIMILNRNFIPRA